MYRLLLVFLLLLPTVAFGGEGPSEHLWGTTPGQIIAEFVINDTSFVSGDCAPYGGNSGLDADCTIASQRLYVASAWTVTRIEAWVGTRPWSVLEACDVDVDFNTTTTSTFQFGSATLMGIGDYTVTTTLVDSTLAAGDYINVRHDTPVPDTYCQSGASCVCVSASAHYGIRIIGTPIQ